MNPRNLSRNTRPPVLASLGNQQIAPPNIPEQSATLNNSSSIERLLSVMVEQNQLLTQHFTTLNHSLSRLLECVEGQSADIRQIKAKQEDMIEVEK